MTHNIFFNSICRVQNPKQFTLNKRGQNTTVKYMDPMQHDIYMNMFAYVSSRFNFIIKHITIYFKYTIKSDFRFLT